MFLKANYYITYHMCMIRIPLPPQPQLVVMVQSRQTSVGIGQVLEVLLRRRTGGSMVKGRGEIGRLKIGLGQLVLHGGGRGVM